MSEETHVAFLHHQHVLGHHIYTNIHGNDPDMPMVEKGDMRLLTHRQAWQWIYKFQWIYMPILYGLLGVKSRMQDVTDTFATYMNGAIRVNPLSTFEWSQMIGTKVLHVIYRVLVPHYYFGLSWPQTFLWYMLVEVTTGFYLAFNFQVSHISTEAFFPLDDKYDTEIAQEWAVIQVITGVDYGHDSKIMGFLCGHLNYQIEHHLLPSVSQYYYPEIAPIVKEVCKKWSIPYNYVPSFHNAVATHIKYLYVMGNKVEHKWNY